MEAKILSSGAKVGFIGLGAMGFQMANRLKVGGCAVKVWNRTFAVAQDHQSQYGTTTVESLNEMASCDVIFSCVPESKHVEEVVDRILPALQKGTIWVDCTSGEAPITRRIGAKLAAVGVPMVDCPVSGGPAGAKAGTLASMCGSNDVADFDRVQPLISMFSKKVLRLGPLGAGHATKAVNNLLNVTHLMLAMEGMTALCKQGIDPELALSVINASSGRSLQTEVRLPIDVLTRKFNYGFKLGLMNKDVRIATSMMDKAFQDVGGLEKVAPISAASAKTLRSALAKYGFDNDYTYAAKFVEEEAGQEVSEQPAKRQKIED